MDNAISVLCVDDDPDILSSLKRQLYLKYNVLTAENGEQGLQVLKESGPVSVVVSDMRMPKMNGANFLAKVKDSSPHTTRVLLTGQSDVDSAVDAINDGRIYRFLMKPCEQEELLGVLESAVHENQMLELEDDLLKRTLYTSAGLIDVIFHSIHPVAHRITSRIQAYVTYMANELNLAGVQQLQSATNLSQLGCLNLPDDIIQKIYAYSNLDDNEKDTVNKHMVAGWNLVDKITDIKLVAMIIAALKESYSSTFVVSDTLDINRLDVIGSQLIRIAIDLDRNIGIYGDPKSAINNMQENTHLYHSQLLDLFANYQFKITHH